MKKIIEFRQVGYSYHTKTGETAALTEFNLEIFQGEFLAVVGPSGCGKSTLLSLLAGLMEPEKGHIFYGENKYNFGYMLQKDQLLEWRTIEKNILLGLQIQKKQTDEHKKKIKDKAKEYGLEHFLMMHPSQLSGGMRQRAALLRTLAVDPEILLLDEPFSALDYQTRLNVSDDIGRLIKREGKTAILVTHDLSEAISLADRIVVLSRRPGTKRCELCIQFPKELTPLMRRNQVEFKDYFNRLWEEINNE
ncbi:MAG: ABC transporter ATP-binding protein [Lachnospiraceae bacterium]